VSALFAVVSAILSITNYALSNYSEWEYKEHRLRVFENRVLRRIFGPKRDEVTGEWRKLHSEEFHILYLSPNIMR
jgi:hypothetical protein